jgi:16S rRNA (uracil1498-N3)-methyltransferase
MRISRLYLPVPLQRGEQIELDHDRAHYVRTVLRLQKASPLTLFNGKGGDWSAILVEVSRKRVAVEVNEWIKRDVESPLRTILGLSISRGDRMDLAVQKAVELGVNEIMPLFTERSVVQLKDEKKRQKTRHWQKIVQHATEQSGRTRVPEINPPCQFYDWLEKPSGLKIFLDPDAHGSIAELYPTETRVTLLSGPEGGFSENEKESAILAGFVPVRLGSRILRTETAALAALAAVQMLWGDFGETKKPAEV